MPLQKKPSNLQQRNPLADAGKQILGGGGDVAGKAKFNENKKGGGVKPPLHHADRISGPRDMAQKNSSRVDNSS